MKTIVLAKGEKLIDFLEAIYRQEKSSTTQIWFDSLIEDELFDQMLHGEGNVPYFGVQRKAFKTNSGTIELSYKEERCKITSNELVPLYLVQHLYFEASREFCSFGIRPTERIIITKCK